MWSGCIQSVGVAINIIMIATPTFLRHSYLKLLRNYMFILSSQNLLNINNYTEILYGPEIYIKDKIFD